jgi:hypothetical protein
MAEEKHTPRTSVSNIDVFPDLRKTDIQDDSGRHYEATLSEHQGRFNVSIELKNDNKNKNSQSSDDGSFDDGSSDDGSSDDGPSNDGSTTLPNTIPFLTICMLVIGTRGDVQPFINFGRHLQKEGHRVRLATHIFYEDLVRSYGLAFFPLAGDPEHLMRFTVKSAGIIPTASMIADGVIEKHKLMFKDILKTCWDACVADDPVKGGAPFRADVIISNPPAYGHIHCAEKLQIPLHILFTMPWTPTDAFPNPFCVPDLQSRTAHSSSFNSLTFTVVDRLVRIIIFNL